MRQWLPDNLQHQLIAEMMVVPALTDQGHIYQLLANMNLEVCIDHGTYPLFAHTYTMMVSGTAEFDQDSML